MATDRDSEAGTKERRALIRQGIAKVIVSFSQAMEEVGDEDDDRILTNSMMRDEGKIIIEKALDEIMLFLHSQGVVIKADRGMPACGVSEVLTGNAQAIGCPYLKAGYVAVEPLIGDKDG
ncbi:hypothetical protein LCGC14_1345110 [marine sediment metagenome]|uniref:Uncharacterized protein n=1 Tax=marine sediment metagenome TaxID=412755 RepID=A0A0F9MTE6_9ZZZZ